MNIKYMGENAISYLIEKCKSTFALITHKHTAQEVGADVEGSASAALVLAQQHTEEKVGELAINVAYIDGEDNEDIVDPDIEMSDVVVDSMLSETSMNPVQNKVVTAKIKELEENAVTSWNDLEDRPFGEEITSIVYVESEPTQVETMFDNVYRGWYDNYDKIYHIIEEGKVYNVYIDDVLYENLTCYEQSGVLSLGSFFEEMRDNNNTEYPFNINYTDYFDTYIGYFRDDTPHTIKIEFSGFGVKQIDAKYIPTIVGKNVYRDVFDIDGTEVTAELGAEIFNDYKENKATGWYSHAEGSQTTASGSNSHAEGWDVTASGDYSHSEGRQTEASGYCSHTEGSYTYATGDNSHAECNGTTASGSCSHAEGGSTTAAGDFAHAEGFNTKASSQYQHVQGKYNIEDTANTYAHIVGNGETYKKLSNAHTLDWSGNAWYQGTVEATAIILKSSTSGSTKRFKITVDDSGAINATEITN